MCNCDPSCGGCPKRSKLSICGLAFAFGLTNGLCMMALALMGMMHWGGDGMITVISSMYYGYAPTVMGSVFGLGWGFLDGFIFGGLVAIFYNCCMCCCKRCWCKGGCKSGTPVTPPRV